MRCVLILIRITGTNYDFFENGLFFVFSAGLKFE